MVGLHLVVPKCLRMATRRILCTTNYTVTAWKSGSSAGCLGDSSGESSRPSWWNCFNGGLVYIKTNSITRRWLESKDSYTFADVASASYSVESGEKASKEHGWESVPARYKNIFPWPGLCDVSLSALVAVSGYC